MYFWLALNWIRQHVSLVPALYVNRDPVSAKILHGEHRWKISNEKANIIPMFLGHH